MADRWYVRATAAFRRPRTWVWIGAVIVAVAVAWRIQAVDGQVIDAATGKPLEGVFVVGRWHGYISLPVQGRSSCYHMAVTRTNADGKFLMSSWSRNVDPLLGDRLLDLYYYKVGYGVAAHGEADQQPTLLTRDARLGKERMEEIGKIYAATDCGSKRRQLGQATPLYYAAADDARNAAVTREDQILARRFLDIFVVLEFDNNEAARRQGERERAEWK